MPTSISAVIFDLGRVMIDFDHMIAARRIARHTEMSGQDVYDLFFDSEATCLFEEGKISPTAFFLRVKDALRLTMSFEEFVPIWNEIFFLTPANRAVHDIARSLRGRYTVALLSNVNALHFDYIKKTYPILDPFHHLLTSYELGARKPDPKIYRRVLGLLGLPPEECFYTDDRQELIESARALGIRGHVYSGVAGLQDALAQAGILP